MGHLVDQVPLTLIGLLYLLEPLLGNIVTLVPVRVPFLQMTTHTVSVPVPWCPSRPRHGHTAGPHTHSSISSKHKGKVPQPLCSTHPCQSPVC